MSRVLNRGERYRSQEPISGRIEYMAFLQGSTRCRPHQAPLTLPAGWTFELLADCYDWDHWAPCWPVKKLEFEKQTALLVGAANGQWYLFLPVTDVQKCPRDE